MKTVRFDNLVRNSGKPEIYTPWGDPKTDAAFQRSVKKNQIVTVHQENVGSRKDFGIVGFHPQKQATYFVFPKSLSADPGSKVVGIKYDRVATPEVREPVKVRAKTRAPKPKSKPAPPVKEKKLSKPAAPPPQPVVKHFKATVRLVLETEVTVEVEATGKKEARQKALELAKPSLDLLQRARTKASVRELKVR
ncbi:MAG TPA: hypothetical protein VEH27_00975 [Methylomirabilota bacterium]|nr:hypothetical protein [Methylomirabilota bacterium]